MKRLLLVLSILGILSIVAPCSYADMGDKSDRLSNGQSSVFSPGYINAVKQRTDEIIRQSSLSARPIENTSEQAKEDLSNKVNEAAMDRPKAELKKKSSGVSGDNKKAEASESSKIAVGAADYNVNIGSGTNKVYENGRLISEVFDGVRHVYAGFNGVGKATIQQAIDISNGGDIVIIKAGTYQGTVNSRGIYNGDINLKNGVSLYGGYDESGARDISLTPTTILGAMNANDLTSNTEINGIKLDTFMYGGSINSYGLRINNSSSFAIANCDIGGPNGWSQWGFGGSTSWMHLATSLECVSIVNSNVTVTDTEIIGDNAVTLWNNAKVALSNVQMKEYYQDQVVAITTPRVYGSNASYDASYIRPQTLSSVYGTTSLDSTQELRRGWDYNGKIALDGVAVMSLNGLSRDAKGNIINNGSLSAIFKGLLANKNALQSGGQGEIDPRMLAKIMEESLGTYALAMSQFNANARNMESALILANILKNPTEDQKLILDAVTALLKDVSNQEQGSISPESIKKAQDDLLQMVAAVLIAQAIPDLLKEGDVASIKNIFQDLNTSKERMMQEYNLAVQPYYREVKKLLAKNLTILQLNNIVSKSMVEEEFNKLEPNQVDKILEKLRKASNKSFEEEYMLQQEAKYRKQYVEPNKKILEEKLKDMMKSFTERISKALETAGAKRK